MMVGLGNDMLPPGRHQRQNTHIGHNTRKGRKMVDSIDTDDDELRIQGPPQQPVVKDMIRVDAETTEGEVSQTKTNIQVISDISP